MAQSDIEVGTLEDASAAIARLLAVTHASYERRAQLEHALESRVSIEQAKGIVAERYGLDVDEAFEVNERIENLAETFDLNAQSLDLICECGDGSCTERLTMTRAEYEQLRSDPHNFAVHPGHEYPDVESVVAKLKGYDIVRKNRGAPKKIAEQTDPRAT